MVFIRNLLSLIYLRAPSQIIFMRHPFSGPLRYQSALLVLCCLVLGNVQAQLTVSALFADHMVLQRNQPIHIWGTAPPETAVYLELHTQLSLAFADEDGNWNAELGALPAGGPYTLEVRTDNETLNFEDILLGEVWVCAGQSNMEWQIRQIANGEQESAAANWPEIRFFKVPKRLENTPKRELSSGNWRVCNPEYSPGFSAVAYFFARNLHLELDVPIGIVEVTWGGTQIDTWISPEGLSVFSDLQEELAGLDGLDIPGQQDSIGQLQAVWDQRREQDDLGWQENWWAANYNWEDWPTTLLPKPWEADINPSRNGSLWLKKQFPLDSVEATQDIRLSLGEQEDAVQVWVNGHLISEQQRTTGPLSTFEVPSSVLLTGGNTVTCRIAGDRDFTPLFRANDELKVAQDSWQRSLAGHWAYQSGTPDLGVRPPSFNPNANPSLVFNGMVASVVGLSIAGVAWYQGESDTGDPFYYRDKQVVLIDDWRAQWGLGDIPFLTTQLPFFRTTTDEPTASSWATLRESQTYTLKRDNTSLTTTIDSGDPFNIHPDNKFLVGTRLAEDARRVVYGEHTLKPDASYFINLPAGNEIWVYFRTHGLELSSSTPEDIPGFSIAGEDGEFIWANARLLNGQSVAVWHPSIPNPKYVRYAWADNPGPLRFVNELGRPVQPFRTDELPTPYE